MILKNYMTIIPITTRELKIIFFHQENNFYTFIDNFIIGYFKKKTILMNNYSCVILSVKSKITL